MAAAAGALALACGADLSTLRETQVSVPPAFLETVYFEGYSAGSRDIEVYAVSAIVDAAERTAELEQVRIELADSGQGAVAIHAESAHLAFDDEDFTLHGRVRGTVGSDQHFETAEVRYDSERAVLWTDRPVKVSRPGLSLEGQGMEVDLRQRKLLIRGRVRTTLQGSG